MSQHAQKNLFEVEPAPWELDAEGDHLLATVVFSDAPGGPYDYRIPEYLRLQVQPGKRLRVPLGRSNRLVIGYCVDVQARSIRQRKFKEVAAVVDKQILLSPSMLRLTRWMADYYLCSWGQVLDAVLPAGVRGQAGTREVVLLSIAPAMRGRLDDLKLPAKQAEVLRLLDRSRRPLTSQQLAAAARCTLAPINSLRQKGILVGETHRVQQTEVEESIPQREASLQTNREQQVALEAISKALESRQHDTILIRGVTSSGKTEVYIRAIEQVIAMGRQAIVLVPEISLTPQTRHRFRSRFEHVAVLHSHLSDAERHWHWQRIARGEVQVVVGARSAVFAPTPQLGLVVLDEEHDSSFKQDQTPRYHARDVALQRARLENIPLVLGSATPSLESWHRAARGEYRLVEMPSRVSQRPLPDVVAVDLRADFTNRRSRGAISRQLHQAIDQALKADGQVILLLNRRGFSTSIQCPACGHVVRCEDCDIALTHHKEHARAICHYCDYQIAAPTSCPKCSFEGIRYSGLGTQRLEAEVRARFQDVSCLRMDSDTMQRPGSHERALEQFRSGEVRILLGTQMIAKGLDFPNVTLVGVINADTALHFPDFRAAERTFQLVTQVAGRTGRGDKGGRVLVQTFSPEHPAIQAALRHDYLTFARQELPVRDEYGYPPCNTMIRALIRGGAELATSQFADHWVEQISAAVEHLGEGHRVLGPAPAPIARLRGKFRYHALVAGPDGQGLRQAMLKSTLDLKPPEDVQWVIDVDPIDML